MEQLEHPAITLCLRTGYPYPSVNNCECPSCEAEINEGDILYQIDGKAVCVECFREWVEDYCQSNPREVAEALNVSFERVD